MSIFFDVPLSFKPDSRVPNIASFGLGLLLAILSVSFVHAADNSVKGQIGVFNPANRSLIVVDDRQIVELVPNDKSGFDRATPSSEEQQDNLIPHEVVQLATTDDGAVWLLGNNKISRWHRANGVCTVSDVLHSISLVMRQTPSDGVVINDSFYLDGQGVVGQSYTIDSACEATASTIWHPPVTVSIESKTTVGKILYRARSNFVKAGPVTTRGPVV